MVRSNWQYACSLHQVTRISNRQDRPVAANQRDALHCQATTLIWLPSQAGAQSGGLSKPSHPPTEADTWLHSCAHSARVCGSDWLHPPALQHQQQQQCRAPQKCTSGTSLKTGRRLNVHPSSSLPSSHPQMQKSTGRL